MKKTWIIGGMSCDGCANRLARVVGKLEGVDAAAVSFADKALTVEYDPVAAPDSRIRERVEEAGYFVLREADL